MKFTVASSLLNKQVQKVIGIVGANNILPILESFKLELSGNELKITASDLETFMSCTGEVHGEQDGVICMNAKILSDYLKAIPEQPIKFEMGENYSISITTDKGNQSLVGEDAMNFPTTIKVDNGQSVDISSEDIFVGLSKCLRTASTDNMRPAMNGININLVSNVLTFVSTDAHRLSLLTSEVKGNEFNVIVPIKPIPHILKNIEQGNVKLSIGIGIVEIETGSTRIGVKLIDAKFPPYLTIIPTDSPYRLTVNKNELLNALKIVSIFANKTTTQVVFNITKNEITLSGQDVDYSYRGEEKIGCDFNDDEMAIAFNGKILTEMMASIETEEVLFLLSTPSRAMLIKNNKEDDTYLGLIMPLMLGV